MADSFPTALTASMPRQAIPRRAQPGVVSEGVDAQPLVGAARPTRFCTLVIAPSDLRCSFDGFRGESSRHRGTIERLSKLIRTVDDECQGHKGVFSRVRPCLSHPFR